MKIITVVGARPQFIKATTVSKIFSTYPDIEEIIIHTGQHYDDNMSDIFFKELELPYPIYLEIGSYSHGKQTGLMLEKIEEQLIKNRPNWVLVYGDTNTTLAAALAAVKLNIPVAHVEAGLRSYNRKMPEEINRVVSDHVSNLLFAPTQTAVDNLIDEGVIKERISLVGDVMFDAAIYYADIAAQKSNILEKIKMIQKKYILATVHRAENTDDLLRLKAIIQGLSQVSEGIIVVLPLHPRTRKALNNYNLIDFIGRNILVIEPVGFLDMIILEKNASLIVTDSGGVQKEAFFYKVPCVILRDETEWVELVNNNYSELVSPNDAQEISKAIKSNFAKNIVGKDEQLFGAGNAAELIVNQLLSSKGVCQN